MSAFFLALLVLGGGALLVQLALGLFGLDGEGAIEADPTGADGLDLFTIRALSAAAAFFGLTGLGAMRLGLPGFLALPLAAGAGFVAALGVAWTMRSLRRLEQDRSFNVHSVLGLPATVSLSIPPLERGAGKVHLVAHERFQEFDAVTRGEEIASGVTVYVVDIKSPDTLVVSRTPSLPEE